MSPIKTKDIAKSRLKHYFFEINRQLNEMNEEPIDNCQISEYDSFSTLYTHKNFNLFVQQDQNGKLEELLLTQEENFLYLQQTNSDKPAVYPVANIKDNMLFERLANKLKEKLGSYQRVEADSINIFYTNLN